MFSYKLSVRMNTSFLWASVDKYKSYPPMTEFKNNNATHWGPVGGGEKESIGKNS